MLYEAGAVLRAGVAKLGYECVTAEDTEEFDRRLLKADIPDSARGLAEEAWRNREPRFTLHEFLHRPVSTEGRRDSRWDELSGRAAP